MIFFSTSKEIGWEDHLWYDIFSVEGGGALNLNSVSINQLAKSLSESGCIGSLRHCFSCFGIMFLLTLMAYNLTAVLLRFQVTIKHIHLLSHATISMIPPLPE